MCGREALPAMIPAPQLAVLAAFAIDLAEVIRCFLSRALVVEDKSVRAGYDSVTIADRAAEAAMGAGLLST